MRRELKIEKEKRKQRFQVENAPKSNAAPSEDAPEQDVAPEIEEEVLETEEELRKITKQKR